MDFNSDYSNAVHSLFWTHTNPKVNKNKMSIEEQLTEMSKSPGFVDWVKRKNQPGLTPESALGSAIDIVNDESDTPRNDIFKKWFTQKEASKKIAEPYELVDTDTGPYDLKEESDYERALTDMAGDARYRENPNNALRELFEGKFGQDAGNVDQLFNTAADTTTRVLRGRDPDMMKPGHWHGDSLRRIEKDRLRNRPIMNLGAARKIAMRLISE